MKKEIESLEFLRADKMSIIDSLKSNGTKYNLTIDNSCEGF